MHVRFLGFSPPRNPLVRVLLAITGAALLGLFVVFGLVIGAAVTAVLGLVALWRQLAAPSARRPVSPQAPGRVPHAPPPPGVIEGEYRVVHRD